MILKFISRAWLFYLKQNRPQKLYITLIKITLLMLDKESLTSIILAQNKTLSKIDLNESKPYLGSFQREKGTLIREILSFHNDRFSQKYPKFQGEPTKTSNLLQFLIKQSEQSKQQPQSQQTSNLQYSSVSHVNTELYYNDYHSHLKKNANRKQLNQYQSNNSEDVGVIDLFLKKNQSHHIPLRIETVPVTNFIKCQNKSFNESTMAVSKLQRSQISPHRKIRKTQNYNPPKLPQIFQYNNSDSLFDLTENQSSSSPQSKQQPPTKKDQIKKVMIDLNHPKHKSLKTTKASPRIYVEVKDKKRMDTSLEEVQQYDELFDCSSQKRSEQRQENKQEIFNYLKNKIIKQKLDKSQKQFGSNPSKGSLYEGSSSNGESLNSFHSMIQRQKKEVNQKGANNIGIIVDQTVKAVNRNIMNEAKNQDNNISQIFFPNASNPSTVHKLDERSNDKSQLLRHLQDLEEYSMSAELFKKAETNEQNQTLQQNKPYKQLTIDLSDLCGEDQVQELYNELAISSQNNESSQHLSMPSFKMESSINPKQQGLHYNKGLKNDQIKRIQIKLESQGPSQQMQRSEVNLDDLSNYISDDQSTHEINQKKNSHQKYQESHNSKPRSKIILKSTNLSQNKYQSKKISLQQNDKQNDMEKCFIQDLKHDVFQLKSKIQASFISQKSDLSFIKQPTNKKVVKISIDLNSPSNLYLDGSISAEQELANNQDISKGLIQLKHHVYDLQNRMIKDAGIWRQA